MRTLFRQGTDIAFDTPPTIAVIVTSDDEASLENLARLPANHATLNHYYRPGITVYVTQEALTSHVAKAVIEFVKNTAAYGIQGYCEVVLTDPLALPQGQAWIREIKSILQTVPHINADGHLSHHAVKPSVTYATYHDFIMSELDPDYSEIVILDDTSTYVHPLTQRLVNYEFDAAYRWG